MKSLNRTFGVSAIAGVCMLIGCASHPLTSVGTSAPVSQTKPAPAVVNPIFASDAPTTQTSPRDTSALPPGHPALPSQSGSLPSGHPAIDSSAGPSQSGSLPPGHPSVNNPAGPAQSGALPPGHPSVGNLANATPASTQPVIAGTLNIKAVQSTAGGPAIGAEPVTIELINSNGQVVSHSDAKLNADGSLDVKGFDVRNGVQPIITVTHSGIGFSVNGEPMDPDHATQKLDVPVYESSDQTPAWSITMRHLIIQPSPAGLDVLEMFSINNKGDHAWIGKADDKGNRTTFSVALPDGLQDLKVGGSLDTQSVTVADGKLISHQPMVPGDDRYEIEYTIPARDNKAVISVVAPVSVGNMLVLIPDDGTTVDAPGLQSAGTQQLDAKGPKTRCFMGNGLAQGQTVTVTVGGLNNAAAAKQSVSAGGMPDASSASTPAAAETTSSSSMMSKGIAVGGAVAILLVGTVITLLKAPKPVRSGKKA